MEVVMTNIADRFAQIEAEYKAIEKLYKAAKAEALEACYAVANDDLKSVVEGDIFTLEFSLTATNTFSAEKAKAFLTDEQIEACMVQGSRQNLKAKAKAKVTVIA
jgi:secreted Zn-dependent insulinase-like peptidase